MLRQQREDKHASSRFEMAHIAAVAIVLQKLPQQKNWLETHLQKAQGSTAGVRKIFLIEPHAL